MFGREYALAFVNNANATATVSCDTSCIRMLLDGAMPAARGYMVRDLWDKKALSNITAATGLVVPVPGEGAVRLVTLTVIE